MAQKPHSQIRCGSVIASIWENPRKSGEGSYQSVTFQRLYRDGDGNWKYSDSFFESDLLALSRAAEKAFDACEEMRRAAAAARSHEPAEAPADAPC